MQTRASFWEAQKSAPWPEVDERVGGDKLKAAPSKGERSDKKNRRVEVRRRVGREGQPEALPISVAWPGKTKQRTGCSAVG